MHATAPDGHASPISDDGCEPPGLSPHARTGPPWPSVQANDCAEPPRLSAHACAGPLGPSAQADGSAEPPRLSALACTGPPRPSVQADDGAEPTRLPTPPGETTGTRGRSTRPGCTTEASTGSAATLRRPSATLAAASREAASCQATGEASQGARTHTHGASSQMATPAQCRNAAHAVERAARGRMLGGGHANSRAAHAGKWRSQPCNAHTCMALAARWCHERNAAHAAEGRPGDATCGGSGQQSR